MSEPIRKLTPEEVEALAAGKDREEEDREASDDEGIIYQQIVITRVIYNADSDDERDVISTDASDSLTLLDGYGMLKFAENSLPAVINGDDGV